MIQFDQYFSKGLKPPTRQRCAKKRSFPTFSDISSSKTPSKYHLKKCTKSKRFDLSVLGECLPKKLIHVSRFCSRFTLDDLDDLEDQDQMESLVIGVSVVAYLKEPQPPPTLEVKMEDLLVGEEAGWESKQLYVKSTGVQNAFSKTIYSCIYHFMTCV